MEDEKHYKVMENILQKINKKYISLPDDEVARNNQIVQVVDDLVKEMCNESVLFSNLFESKFHGGSYYDGLKVGKPNEYDLDYTLVLPKIVSPTVEVSDKPGFVHIVLKTLPVLAKKKDELPKFPGLEDLLVEDKVSSEKVLAWIESLIAKSLKKFKDGSGFSFKSDGMDIKFTTKKSGPAFTIKLQATTKDKPSKVDIDLVFSFKFSEKHWPQANYRSNESDKAKTFFVVPKSPTGEPLYWRLSFQEQEKEILKGSRFVAGGYNVLKPALRLIKKLRDYHNHTQIASYFIKTIFLWEIEENPSLWSNNLSVVIMAMLKKYAFYLKSGKIPYFWNREYNLLSNISPEVVKQIGNTVSNMIKKIDSKFKTDPFIIAQFFVTEIQVEELRNEVNLSPKQLRRLTEDSIAEKPQLFFEDNSQKSATLDNVILIDLNSNSNEKAKNDNKLLSILNQQHCDDSFENFANNDEKIPIFDQINDKLTIFDKMLKQINENVEERFEKQKQETESLFEFMQKVDEKLDKLLELTVNGNKSAEKSDNDNNS